MVRVDDGLRLSEAEEVAELFAAAVGDHVVGGVVDAEVETGLGADPDVFDGSLKSLAILWIEYHTVWPRAPEAVLVSTLTPSFRRGRK